MEVKAGYKQTEVGVIPEDWHALPISDLITRVRLGGNYKNSEQVSSRPLIKMGNMGRGNIVLNKIEYVPDDYQVDENHRLRSGDVIFNTRNTLELVGKVCIWRDELALAYYNSNILRLEFSDCQIASGYFANYALNSHYSIIGLREIATGTTSVAAIYTKDFLQFKILVPPIPEQQLIANALSDVDELIASLDALIAKKRDLKQAAMQQLLTGKTRLQGFSGEWEAKQLGEVVIIVKGQLITQDTVVDGTIPVIAGGKKPAYFHNAANRFGKTITISGSGASAGYVAKYDEPIFASDCCTISEGSTYHLDYIYYYLLSKQSEIYKSQTGGAQPHIHPRDLKPMIVGIPLYDEQTAIAEVLSNMDAELVELEQRRKKTIALKQGMMQELLTGRTRLI